VFAPEFIETIDGAAAGTILERVYAPPEDADSLQRHLRFALHTATADDDLPKVQRTCAWHGIEARFPLLADEVRSFSDRLHHICGKENFQQPALLSQAFNMMMGIYYIKKCPALFSTQSGYMEYLSIKSRDAVFETLKDPLLRQDFAALLNGIRLLLLDPWPYEEKTAASTQMFSLESLLPLLQ
jgi:hypothetical protein